MIMMYHLKHLRTKFILAIGLPMIVVFTIMAFVEYRYAETAVLQSTKENVEAFVANMAMQINQMCIKNSQIARNNASFYRAFPDALKYAQRYDSAVQVLRSSLTDENPELFGMTVSMIPLPDEPSYAVNCAEDGFVRPDTSPYVHRIPGTQDQIGTTDLVNQGGVYYSIDHWRGLKWYAEPFKTLKSYWSPPYIDDTPGLEDVWMVTCSIPVLIEGRQRAICTVDISLEKIRQLLESIKPPVGYLILLSPDGKMIYNPEFQKPVDLERLKSSECGYGFTLSQADMDKLKNITIEKKADHVIMHDVDDYKNVLIAVSQPVSETGWSLIHVISEQDVLKPLVAMFWRQSLLYSIILLTTMVILSIVSSVVTKPLEDIDQATERIIDGDLSVRLHDMTSNDEAGRLAKTFNHMLETLKETVDQKAQESAARRTIENDVSRAREIQSKMLPDPKSLAKSDKFDIYALNLPARFVAGDFYDFWMLDNQTLALVVADVCGKGTPAAMFMAMSRTILRGVANARRSPAETLRRMNEILNHSNDQMFVTLFYAQYNIYTGHMVYANGGHLPPIVRHNDGSVEECPLPFGFPVGIIPDARFDQFELDIAPGEGMCIYTDGVSEATAETETGEKMLFGANRIVAVVQREGNVSPETLCKDMARIADSFRKSERQDDITVLAIRRK